VIVYESGPLTLDASWLVVESPHAGTVLPPRKSVGEEKEVIEQALAAAGGRVSGPAGAAAQLGMPASTLESKIRSLGINKYRFKTV